MKNKPIIYVVLLALLIIFVQHGCYRTNINRIEDSNALLLLDKQTVSQEVNKRGDTISSQKAIILNNEKILNKYADSIFQLKHTSNKTLTYTREVVRTEIDTFTVRYTDSAISYTNDSAYRRNSITVPRHFALDSALFVIEGIVKKDGVTINNIIIPDTIYGRFTQPKTSWFHRPEIQYQTFHSNPLVHNKGLTSTIYHPKKKPVLKTVLQIAIIAGAGFLVGTAIK